MDCPPNTTESAGDAPPSAPCYPTRMSSQPPPEAPDEAGATSGAPAGPKRPRYLVVALVAAMMFGAGCWTEGCNRLLFYRGESDIARDIEAGFPNEADRAHLMGYYRRFAEAADASRSRSIPLAAAVFVLGAALLAFGARGLAGRTNTRSVLVQLVTAQAIVVGVSYFAVRETRWAERDLVVETQLYEHRSWFSPSELAQAGLQAHGIRRIGDPTWLALRTIASGLIVFALTRSRSREFFEAAGSRAVADTTER